MKSLITLILIVVFLGGSSEFKELCKLPLLIQHYSKHKTETRSLSLLSFLKHHYTKESENDNDDNEDSRLPFKTIGDNHIALVYLPASDFIISNDIENVSSYNSRYSNWKPFDLLSCIFHPPCHA